MERIRLRQIEEGQTFEQALFSSNGQKLLSPGVVLSARHVRAIQRCGELNFYLADNVSELVEAGVVDPVDNSQLAVGQKARRNLMSDHGQVVVEQGEDLEPHHLDALRAGGKAYMSQSDAASQRRERILLADALVDEVMTAARETDLTVKPDPGDSIYRIEPVGYEKWPKISGIHDLRSEHVESIRGLFARIEAGITVSILQFNDIIDDLLNMLSEHPARFTQLALLTPRRDDYLPDHVYTVTVLAMAAAHRLRWPKAVLRELGLTGLLFDLGMLLVPQRIRVGACELSDIDRNRVQRHPVFSLAMLQCVEGVPMSTRIASLQHHEREHGRGYPHNLRKDQIGHFAKLIAVADTFAATTEPRHYRNPKMPYIAMEELLRSASASELHKPMARALIEAAGLFPVGSYVRLSNGVNATVIECNAGHLDRPVVQPLDDNGHPTDRRIDLAESAFSEIKVARPIQSATG